MGLFNHYKYVLSKKNVVVSSIETGFSVSFFENNNIKLYRIYYIRLDLNP